MARPRALLLIPVFLGSLCICAAATAQASPKVEAAIRAAAEAAEGSNTQAFVVAVLHGDEYVVRSWPKPLGDQRAVFALLDHSLIVQALLVARIRSARGKPPDPRFSTAVQAPRPGGVLEQGRVRFSVDELLTGKCELGELFGPVAEQIAALHIPWESFYVLDRSGRGGGRHSVLPFQILRGWLEKHGGRSWEEQLGGLLGPPDPDTDRLQHIEQLLQGLRKKPGPEPKDEHRTPPAAASLATGGLFLGELRAHALLAALQAQAQRAAQNGSPWPASLLPLRDDSRFHCATSARGRLASFLAVETGGGTSVLISALGGATSCRAIGDVLLDELEGREVEKPQWNSAIGLGEGAARPKLPPRWTEPTFAGSAWIGPQKTPFRLRILGWQRAELSFGTASEWQVPASFHLHATGAFLRFEAALEWLPPDLRASFAERGAYAEVTLQRVGESLFGSLVLVDAAVSWAADNCLPGVISLSTGK